MKNHFLIIDGKNLLWRCSDAFKDLSVEIGDKEIATGGIYGFLSLLVRIHSKYGGHTIIAWEGKNNFRYKLFPKYKDRGEIDPDRVEFLEELKEQEKRLKAILRAMGIKQYYGIECEADDVIGTIVERVKPKNVTIYTADSDLRQLVSDRVLVVAPAHRKGTEKRYDIDGVVRRHGVLPEFIPDLKALAGDTSDKIPGVKGVGDKYAAKLVDEYGDIEDIIKGINDEDWPIAERFKKIVFDSKKEVRLYKKLTTIKTDAKIKEIKSKISDETLIRHLRFYKFKSMIVGEELENLINVRGYGV